MQTGFYFSQMPLVNRGSDTLKVKVSQVYMVMVSVTIKQTSLNQQQVTEAGRMAMSRKANLLQHFAPQRWYIGKFSISKTDHHVQTLITMFYNNSH